MGSNTGTVWQEAQNNQIASVFQRKGRSESPHGFIHSDPPDHHRSHLPSLCLSQGSSIRLSGELWSLAEILGGSWRIFPGGIIVGPPDNPLSYSFPVYLILKCSFLAWCMVPAKWNGSDLLFNQVLFPLFKEHHKEIEEQAEKAKQSIKDKLGDFFKNEKKENGKKEKLDKIENFFKAKDKPEKPEKEEKSQKQN